MYVQFKAASAHNLQTVPATVPSKTLNEIGIKQDGTTGKLKIDDDKLKKVLNENTASVRELLVGDGKETGITTKIATEVKGYLCR